MFAVLFGVLAVGAVAMVFAAGGAKAESTNTTVFFDNFSTFTGWTYDTTYYNGALASDGNELYWSTYGTPYNNFHGVNASKSIASTISPSDDFTITAKCRIPTDNSSLSSSNCIYLLNETGFMVAYMMHEDSQAAAGYGDFIAQINENGTMVDIYPYQAGGFSTSYPIINGEMKLTRTDGGWSFYYNGVKLGNTIYYNTTSNIAKVNIVFSKSQSYSAVDFRIDNITVYKGMGLVAEWKFDEGSGTTAVDSSGNNNNGTINGAAWTSAGISGNALQFDGINDYVAVPISSSLDSPSGAVTISMWVKLDALPSSDPYVLWRYGTSGTAIPGMKSFGEVFSNGSICAGVTSNGGTTYIGGALFSTTKVSASTWYLVTLTYNSALSSQNVKLYVNGVQESSANGNDSLVAMDGYFWIARNGNAASPCYVDGTIDEVRIYNRAQSASEIQTAFNALAPIINNNTGAGYTKIQDAINASVSGQTIFVKNGIYNIDWLDGLTISKSINLTGESNQNTIIKGSGVSNSKGVYITASNVNVTNIKVDNFEFGIYLSGVANCRIENNTVVNNANGDGINIFMGSGSNKIANNTIGSNYYGISIVSSPSNVITDNTLTGNSQRGIYFSGATGSTIQRNTINNSANGIYASSDTNIFGNNSITNCTAYDVYITSSSALTFVNTTFNSSKVYCDTNSNLMIKNYLDVVVKNQSNAPIQNAIVEVIGSTPSVFVDDFEGGVGNWQYVYGSTLAFQSQSAITYHGGSALNFTASYSGSSPVYKHNQSFPVTPTTAMSWMWMLPAKNISYVSMHLYLSNGNDMYYMSYFSGSFVNTSATFLWKYYENTNVWYAHTVNIYNDYLAWKGSVPTNLSVTQIDILLGDPYTTGKLQTVYLDVFGISSIGTDANGTVKGVLVTDRDYIHSSVPTENYTTVNVLYNNLVFTNNNRSVNMSTSHTENFTTYENIRNNNTGYYYLTIQDAINASSNGQTIYVKNGTYYEHAEVNKSITLVGESNVNTILDGTGNPTTYAVNVTASYATVSNLAIKNWAYGIYTPAASNYVNLTYNRIEACTNVGLYICGNYNNISYNYVANGTNYGMYLFQSTGSNISNNNFYYNSNFNMGVDYSTGTRISNNTAYGGGYALLLGQNTNNSTIEFNNFSNCLYAIKLFYSGADNIVYNSTLSAISGWYDIYLQEATYGLTVVNTTFNGSMVFCDANSKLTVKNYLDVVVSKPAISGWWDLSWNSRKMINITNAGAALTNYPIKVTVNYIDSKMKNDFSDIRFIDSTGQLLNYWIQNYTAGVQATVWVNVTSLPASTTTAIYVYYGNPSASSASNGNNVFTFFDDFAGTTIDGTKFRYSGGPHAQNEILTTGASSNQWGVNYFYSKQTFARVDGLTFQGRMQTGTAAQNTMFGWQTSTGTQYGTMPYAFFVPDANTIYYYENGGGTTTAYSFTDGVWYDVKVVLKAAGAKYYYKLTTTETWTLVADTSTETATNLAIGFDHYGGYCYMDNWFIYAATSTEPTYLFGGDETLVIQNANVVVKDNNVTVASGQTDANGTLKSILVTDRVYNGSNSATENITTISITKTGLAFLSRDVNMSTSHTESFTTYENIRNNITGYYYATIQDAINDSSIGQTIYVKNGTYYERFTISKTITLTGENQNTTIIDGSGTGSVVTITANYVNVSGFTVRNSGSNWNDACIKATSTNNRIASNMLTGSAVGLYLYQSTNNTVTNNTITSTTGVSLSSSSNNNTFMYNVLTNCTDMGFNIDLSSNNNLMANTITNTSQYGIRLYSASNNNILSNTITNSGSYDFYLASSSSATSINTSFNASKVYCDASSSLTVKNYLIVLVRYSNGTPIQGAVINVTDNNVSVINSETSFIRNMTGHTSYVISVAFSPDGTKLASGSYDNTIKLWNTADGSLIRTLSGHTNNVYSVTFSPDGTKLASGSEDNTIKLWNTADGSLLRTLSGHTGYVNSVTFSPDGTKLASGSHDNTIKLWNTADGSLLRTLSGHTGYVYSVAFSPDGTKLASGSTDSTIKLWNTADGSLIRTLSGHTNWVLSVTFSPDGTKLASGSTDSTIKLWNTADGSLIRTLSGHTNGVISVAFSPDGTKLASGSNDNTIKLWNTADGSPLRTLSGHTNGVYSVAFSPDGTKLASGSTDNTIKLWHTYFTDSSGATVIEVTDRIYSGSSTATENTTVITVSYPELYFGDNPRIVNMSTSHTETFVVIYMPTEPVITTTPYTDTDGSYLINWTASNYAANYVLEENGAVIFNNTNASCTYAFANKPDGIYTYRMQAWNVNDSSGWSSPITIIVDNAKPPGAPSITTTPCTGTDSSYSINWTASNYVVNYILEENSVVIFNNTNTSLIYTFAGKPDGTYTYRIRAWNINGTSSWSTAVTIIVDIAKMPSVPSITTTSYTNTAGSYSINWTTSAYATKYTLEENSIEVYNDTTLTYSFTSKSDGIYTYRVKTWNINGTSSWSSSVTIIVDNAKLPGTPSITTASYMDTDGTYSINWTTSTRADKYILEESGIEIYNNTALTYSFTSKHDGAYTYRVKAWNINGSSSWSAAVDIVEGISKLPGTPSITTASHTDTDGSYNINWSSAVYATNYILEENNIEIYNGTALTYSLSGKPDSSNSYRVKAWNTNGTSSWSSSVTIIVDIAKLPGTPTITTTPQSPYSGSSYSIAWTTSAYAAKYILEENGVQIYFGTDPSYSFTDKADGTYSYRAGAWNANGTSSWSSALTFTVFAPKLPGTPAIITTPYTNTAGSYSVNWTSSAYASKYVLEENGIEIYNSTALTYSLIGKSDGTFSYMARAWNVNGTSNWSTPLTITVDIAKLPGTPTITTTPPYPYSGSTYSIAWTASAYAAKYILEENSTLVYYNGTGLTYGFIGKSDGTYSYRVRAWNINGTSSWSSAIAITVFGAKLPGATAITTAAYTDTEGSYNINWTASAYATKYALEENGIEIYNSSTALIYSLAGKTDGTYIYRIRAWNINGTSSWSSAVSIIVENVKLPGAPTITTAGYTNINGTYSINWTTSAYADKYILEENGIGIYNGTALAYSFTSKADGTYTYRVMAWNANGTSQWSLAIDLSVGNSKLPGTPSITTVSHTDTDGNYNISWSSALYADNYTLEENNIEIYNGTALTYPFTGKSDGTYTYRVKAQNTNGTSSWGSSVTIVVDIIKSSGTTAITTAAYTDTDGIYSINWTSSSYASKYILEENDIEIYNGTTPTCSLTGKADGAYAYRVKAWNINSTSDWSSTVAITVDNIKMPGTPSITTTAHTDTDGAYRIDWVTSVYASKYILEENGIEIYNGTNLTHTVTGKTDGAYTYRIKAWNINGTSNLGTPVTVMVDIAKFPATIGITTAAYTDTSGSYSINWTTSAYAAKYILEENGIEIYNETTLACSLTGKADGAYTYRVKTWNINGTSDWCAAVTIIVDHPKFPMASMIITIPPYPYSNGNYSIAWTLSAYAAKYILEENGAEIYNGTNTAYQFTGKADGFYTYRVKVWNINGTSSWSSALIIRVVSPKLPGAPAITTIIYTDTDGAYPVNWTASSYAIGYVLEENGFEIYRSTALTYQLRDRRDGAYAYRVKAWNFNGTSNYSAAVTIIVNFIKYPGVPTITTAPYMDIDGSFTVNWTTSAYAAKYILEENGTEIWNGTALSYSFTGKSEGNYTYRAKAWNANGTSGWSPAVSIAVRSWDYERPRISITSHRDNDKVKTARIKLEGTAIDNKGIAKVEVSIDNKTWVLANGTASWSIELTLVEGKNTIQVKATDLFGNTETAALEITYGKEKEKEKKKASGFLPGFEAIAMIAAIGLGVLTISDGRKRRQ